MAKNNLTPEQDIICRQFYVEVAIQSELFLTSPSNGRRLRGVVLDLLNYVQLPSGAYVSKDTKVAVEYGSKDYSKWPDEWADDARKANEAIDNKSEPETSTGSKSTYTKVRKALLSEDV